MIKISKTPVSHPLRLCATFNETAAASCQNTLVHFSTRFTERSISTTLKPVNLRRSYLYVPASSDRMLEKSITTGSDVIIYDLEDSVSPVPLDKANARGRLKKFLEVRTYFCSYFQT